MSRGKPRVSCHCRKYVERRLAPEASQEHAAVSQELVQGLTAEQPWTAWSKWFTNTVED